MCSCGYCQYETKEILKFVLSSKTPKVLWIPPGNYNGFKSLEENTSILFFSTTTLHESLEMILEKNLMSGIFGNEEYR